LVWADGSAGGWHTNFNLSPAGGTVYLFDQSLTLVDFLAYGAAQVDRSAGRFPDAGADVRDFPLVTPAAANEFPPSPLILNEYNAVADNQKLDNLGTDPFWTRVDGNGGDWFELVVTMDHLDVRGWRLVLTDNTGPAQIEYVLDLTWDALWSDLRAGTIVTVT
jgi:hypothetical protein